ncbi:hypothetical protein NDU88_002865 [Pleurodeles waltl]|uniref:Uncharacterized protein n=1 Tax=Pleurodeles waltl TaxID=8319 RepID=A0AAV7W5S9_PLEWA|nr:hypothetical protein NDU88_002865 [Pleurodeles waltl]
MNTKISDLAAERSIISDITEFQDKVTGMKHRFSLMDDKLNSMLNRVKELQYFWDKLTSLKNRSDRDNVRSTGFPERAEGRDAKAFLKNTLTGLTFSSPPGASTST